LTGNSISFLQLIALFCRITLLHYPVALSCNKLSKISLCLDGPSRYFGSILGFNLWNRTEYSVPTLGTGPETRFQKTGTGPGLGGPGTRNRPGTRTVAASLGEAIIDIKMTATTRQYVTYSRMLGSRKEQNPTQLNCQRSVRL